MIVIDPVKTAGAPILRPVEMNPKPQTIDNQKIRNTTDTGGEFSDEPDVFPVRMTVSANKPVSLQLEEDMGQCVEVGWEATLMAAPVEYEEGHMMEWPDIKSDGVMMDDIMLKSETSPVGSVRSAAEPVLLATKSEVFSPVVLAGGGGSLLRQPPGRGRGSHSASFCPTGCWKQTSNRFRYCRRRYGAVG